MKKPTIVLRARCVADDDDDGPRFNPLWAAVVVFSLSKLRELVRCVGTEMRIGIAVGSRVSGLL